MLTPYFDVNAVTLKFSHTGPFIRQLFNRRCQIRHIKAAGQCKQISAKARKLELEQNMSEAQLWLCYHLTGALK